MLEEKLPAQRAIERASPGRRRRRFPGFSLIEVLISMSLLAVGMAAIATTYTLLSDSALHQRRLTHALHVAEATMEDLLLRYASDADLTQGPHAGPSFTQEGTPGGTYFVTTWEVQTGVPIANARQVRVTVTWTEATGTKTLSIVTVRT